MLLPEQLAYSRDPAEAHARHSPGLAYCAGPCLHGSAAWPPVAGAGAPALAPLACEGGPSAGVAPMGGTALPSGPATADAVFCGVHFFAGAHPREDGIAGWAHMMGGVVADVDTATGGPAHDLRRAPVLHRWQRALRSGEFDIMYGGGPCATFSPRHAPQLRTISEPRGMRDMPLQWRAHVDAANDVWDHTALLAREQFAAGGEFVIEYPQRRYIRGRRAFWRKMADRGVCTPGDLPSILDLEKDTGAVRVDIRQCALGGRFQKFTTLLCSPRVARELDFLTDLPCDRCDRYEEHEERATGVFPDGSSRAAAAAAYPSEMNRVLSAAGAACRRGPRRSPPPGGGLPISDPGPPGVGESLGQDGGFDDGLSDGLSEADTVDGGAPSGDGTGAAADGGASGVAAGPGLPRAIRARVEAARAVPPRFASLRNLADASSGELRRTAMPHLPVFRSDAQPAPLAAAWGADKVGPQSGRPAGPLGIRQLFLPGVFELIETWRAQAETALRNIRSGRPASPPATLTIAQGQMQPWARGIVWDTRRPGDCHPVSPTTADSPDSCERSLKRDQVRAAAEAMQWPDFDMRAQFGGGGVESRSTCSADTVLTFHHAGIVDHFAAVDDIVRGDREAGWVLGGFGTLPFVPCRSLPRNVVVQLRSRALPGGSVEDYEKLRITTNLSDGEGALGDDGLLPLSVNEGVPHSERTIVLPAVRQLGQGAAIVGEAGRADGLRAELYCLDLKSAFRYTPLQRRDWWQHAFLWITPDGRAEWMVDAHGSFGGAYMPQRFERLTCFALALARSEQDAFDRSHPYPPGVQAWAAERERAQCAGALPGGADQTRPAYSHVYLDDVAGAALNDSVPVPPKLRHIPIGELATRSLGGEPSAFDSRAAVHLRIAIAAFERLGFAHEASKTECGSAIVSLGFRVRVDARRIDCPLPKRRLLRRDVGSLRRAVDGGEPLNQESVERLTGKLANLSHVLPELASHLAGGYAVASARVHRARCARRARPGEVRLRRGGRCEEAVRAMCDVAEHLLSDNDGIALASAELFPSLASVSTLTTVTDASGDDGIGGYAFLPSRPGEVWLLAEEWPPDIRSALAFAAQPRAERLSAQGGTACSMPLAELFGPWALACAMADVVPGSFTSVISVVDCAPAATVLSSATSAGAQLRSLVRHARRDCRQWLAVAVPREWNVDADTLSHPVRWGEVSAAAQAAGLKVRGASTADGATLRPLAVPDRCWAALRAAIALPMGRAAAAWREAGELTVSRPAAARQQRRRAATCSASGGLGGAPASASACLTTEAA